MSINNTNETTVMRRIPMRGRENKGEENIPPKSMYGMCKGERQNERGDMYGR